VPVFEIFVAGDGQILARECEAHEGWHVNSGIATFARLDGGPHLVITRKGGRRNRFERMDTGFPADVTHDLCACGLQTPRLINLSTEGVRVEDEVAEELLLAEC
jgi:hypothetical protein